MPLLCEAGLAGPPGREHCITKLEERKKKADMIFKQAEMCRKLETEEEKVLPFDCDAVSQEELHEAQGGAVEMPPGPDGKPRASLAMFPNGTTVNEFTALDGFWKRYNKVLLDKLAIETEQKMLEDENVRLRSILKQYLDGISVSESVLSSANTLMVVNCG